MRTEAEAKVMREERRLARRKAALERRLATLKVRKQTPEALAALGDEEYARHEHVRGKQLARVKAELKRLGK